MGTVITERRRRFQRARDAGPFTKAGGPFVTFLTLNAKPLRAGRYRIAWYLECKMQVVNGTNRPRARVELDGAQNMGLHVWPADDQWDGKSGFRILKFNDGDTPTFTLDVRRDGNAETIDIQNLWLTLELVSSRDD